MENFKQQLTWTCGWNTDSKKVLKMHESLCFKSHLFLFASRHSSCESKMQIKDDIIVAQYCTSRSE